MQQRRHYSHMEKNCFSQMLLPVNASSRVRATLETLEPVDILIRNFQDCLIFTASSLLPILSFSGKPKPMMPHS